MTVRKILVPIDFSAGSLAAVRRAHDLARTFDSHLHLLHVTADTDTPLWATELFGRELAPLHLPRLQAVDRLATVIVWEGLDPRRTTGLVRAGRAATVICDYAEEIHADLIVMGVHGDRFIPQAGPGEVVERVLAQVHCPVLAVPEDAIGPPVETRAISEHSIAC